MVAELAKPLSEYWLMTVGVVESRSLFVGGEGRQIGDGADRRTAGPAGRG